MAPNLALLSLKRTCYLVRYFCAGIFCALFRLSPPFAWELGVPTNLGCKRKRSVNSYEK